jgi:hypothetical protein
MTLDNVMAHVEGYHEGLELLIEKTAKGMAGYSSSQSNRLSVQGSSKSASAAAATTTDRVSEQNLSEEINYEEQNNNDDDDPLNSKKLASHPLAKCPNCPKVLLLRGIFGHFGRVHGGLKFDWGKVAYHCPFCDAEGKECATYTTFEETQAHVEEEHEGCTLVHITPSTRGNNSSNSSESSENKEDSPPMMLRTSQRKRTSVSSIDAEDPSPASHNKRGNQTTTSILYQCPSCERTFNKQGLATHYGMVHSKTLNWDKVQIVQCEGSAYICPVCERSFSKGGLTTHYGMMHDGRLDWDKVKTVDDGDGVKRKRETDIESSEEEEEGGEEEEEEGPVRKSRRISARASRSMDDDDGDDKSASSAAGGSVSSNAPALNFGPWTTEEHEAFLIGHQKYGNSWSLISQQFVPVC